MVNVNVNVNVNLNNLNTSLTKEIDRPIVSPLNSRKYKESPKIRFDKPVLTEPDESRRPSDVII
jgi:hypothetical protein